MSGGVPCKDKKAHRAHWVVIQRNGNQSAFNGYRWQYSDYSCIHCRECGALWRTKAKYVDSLPDGEINAKIGNYSPRP